MPAIAYARFASELLSLYEPPLRAPATFRQMRQVLGEFGSLGCVRKTSDLTPASIAAWLKVHPDRRPVTASALLRPFRAACGYALKMGYLRVSPFEIRKVWVDASAEEPAGPRHHSLAAVAAVLRLLDDEARGGGWAEARLQALVYTYAYTGLRKTEALQLHQSDVEALGRILRVRKRRGYRLKTRASAAPIAIAEELASVLLLWLPRSGSEWVFPNRDGCKPWTGGSPGKKPLDQVKAAGRRAGVANLTILSFRHCFATHSKLWGFGPLQLKAFLRHSTIATQAWYLEDDLEDLRASARRISYG